MTVEQPVRVLVVEDHVEQRDLLVRVLARVPGVKTVSAVGDADSAISAAKRLNPDVILMDLGLPDKDGIEATKEILASDIDSRVIAVTVFGDSLTLSRALCAGCRGFLLKSELNQMLYYAIHVVHSGKCFLSPAPATEIVDRYFSPSRVPLKADYLTAKELHLLQLIGTGLNNKEIAVELHLSATTVKSYITKLLGRTRMRDRVQLVLLAHQLGLASSSGSND